MRMSKNFYYESPYSVTGTIQHAGSEGNLKADMIQIGILERGKVGTQSQLQTMKCYDEKCLVAYNIILSD